MTFDRGRARDFDLVIGADGLHSNVRRLVFGPGENFEHYLGCKVAACVVDGYRPRDELVYVTYNTPGRQVARFALRGDRTMFLFVFRAEHETSADCHQSSSCASSSATPDGNVRSILAALDDVDDLYFDVVSQVRMDRWSQGRVLLIGDAAGCISLLGGEGTGLAMTEAYVLGRRSFYAPTATTAAPSTPTRPGCVRSSSSSRPAPDDSSASSPPAPASASGSATSPCAP